MHHSSLRIAALLATSSAVSLLASAAMAQTANTEELLGEVVVTATRQADTVNRVPLSVTAVTQRSIDQSGVRNLQDLSRTVPAVTFRRAGGESNPSIAVRGISSVLGSPTTAVYLDDTPLQKRDNAGSASGNGTPTPPLFDLERVEVLRGPQGTLYGGSAEGGAIRFLTPAPSLTRRSVYAKGEVSSTKEGGWSYEGGVAVGGPIIADKIGFRMSIFARHTGGYIDQVSMYDAHVIAPDVNRGNTKVGRIAFTFAPTERLRITPAMYWSMDQVSAQDVFWEDVPQYTVNSGTFTNAGTVNGVRFNFADKVFVGGTYGPFNQYGPYASGNGYYLNNTDTALKQNSPRTTRIEIPTLTFDYQFDHMSVKAITSWLGDLNKGFAGGQQGVRSAVVPTSTNAGFIGPNGQPVPGGAGSASLYFPGYPQQWQQFHFWNSRHGLIQEIRFASDQESPLTWVGGIFYSYTNLHSLTFNVANEQDVTLFLRGIDAGWLLGQVAFPNMQNAQRETIDKETEIAAFGDVNYQLTSKLKATAGVRVSRSTIDYGQYAASSIAGGGGFIGIPAPPAIVTEQLCGANPSACNPRPEFHVFPIEPGDNIIVKLSEGQQKESPITPKFGLSYQADDRNLFYATIAKGYRTGGLNQPVPPGTCAQDLAALGLTGRGSPLTYDSDTVWSYEGGAKMRVLGGKVQLNSSVFYIDWKNPQLQNRLRCGTNYTVNAGHAVSKGFDLQAQARLGGFTLNFSAAYTNGKYTEEYSIPIQGGGKVVIVNKGDELGSPDWQFNIGGQYDFNLMGSFDAYLRADYQYSGTYQRGVGPGASGYDAITAKGAATNFVTARAGVNYKQWDVNLFVNNLTNSQNRLFRAHGAASPLITGSTFRPREIGMQMVYRY